IEHVRSDSDRLPLTQIGRQATPSRTRRELVQSHQSLDPMQPTSDPVVDHVAPYAPGPIGPAARQKAGAHFGSQILITTATHATRSRQPFIKAAARDTERPAHPCRRPDPPVLCDEAKLHVLSFAK